ncbi:hypothetical protein PV325_009773, partial [Microctonus aethiopoides]
KEGTKKGIKKIKIDLLRKKMITLSMLHHRIASRDSKVRAVQKESIIRSFDASMLTREMRTSCLNANYYYDSAKIHWMLLGRWAREKSKSRVCCAVKNCHNNADKDLNVIFHSFAKPGVRSVVIKNYFGNFETVDKLKAWKNLLKINI